MKEIKKLFFYITGSFCVISDIIFFYEEECKMRFHDRPFDYQVTMIFAYTLLLSVAITLIDIGTSIKNQQQ